MGNINVKFDGAGVFTCLPSWGGKKYYFFLKKPLFFLLKIPWLVSVLYYGLRDITLPLIPDRITHGIKP